ARTKHRTTNLSIFFFCGRAKRFWLYKTKYCFIFSRQTESRCQSINKTAKRPRPIFVSLIVYTHTHTVILMCVTILISEEEQVHDVDAAEAAEKEERKLK